jgi:ElaB/YqjD/DUF883 family membrane-anchored ribosome-binding protein
METHFPGMETSQSRLARERLLEDMRTLARDAESLLKATADDVSEKAREARARVTAALEQAKATYQEIQAQGVEKATAAARKADDTIRAHPYESIGVAFGVGILIGALLRRK